ncbi:MAG TPA: FKBP-type peptidyl-prolyl cis-trans isomerase, partial [Ktedonobacterales bacterium]
GAAVCDVLGYLHARRPPIILRDLKPANIMVTPEDEVRVIDFGIARTYKLGQTTNTENFGTIIYASPEHLGRTGQTDARSDLYSLGATLYHVLTNHEPRPMTTPAPGSLRQLNPALSEAAERVVVRAMQLDPARRYQSAAEMAAALRAALATAPASRQSAARLAPSPRMTQALARSTQPSVRSTTPPARSTQPPGRPPTAPARVTVPRPLTPPPAPRNAPYGAGTRYVDRSAIVVVVVIVALVWLLATQWPFHVAFPARLNGHDRPSAAGCPTLDGTGINGAAAPAGGAPAITGRVVTTGDCLEYVDAKVGTGPLVKAGDSVTVNYTGWLTTGQEFDSTQDAGRTPFQVTDIGRAQVIAGWNEGLIGMRVGGTRRLIIPAALGYGASGAPSAIPPDATLIFDVTVVSIP